jgi:hypothetical protein
MNVMLPLGMSALALSACATPHAVGAARVAPAGYGVTVEDRELFVTRQARVFGYSDGLEARKAADAYCMGRVNSSTADNFRDGAWRFPQGCA